MKFLISTSVASPHMLPFAGALEALAGRDSVFYEAAEPDLEWRRQMGWVLPGDFDRILRTRDNPQARAEADRLWRECDIVLCPERDDPRMRERIGQGRHTFYAAERWWKPPFGRLRLAHPAYLKRLLVFRALAASPFFHHLPIGVLAARDLAFAAGAPGGQRLWGYFTHACGLPDARSESGPVRILSAGRLLALKHPGDILRAFENLREEGIDAELTYLGDGPERERLEKRARDKLPAGAVRFLPSRPMREVWAAMAAADIFVQTSDGREGWGAVVNEAMSCGCALAASRQSGAAATMLRHGENALLHDAGDVRTLAENLKRLCRDAALRQTLAAASKKDIDTLWSPAAAAARMLEFGDALLSGKSLPEYASGPLSATDL